MSVQAAREQARIAIELADPDDAAVRSLAAAVHRLADAIEALERHQGPVEK